MEQLFLTTKLWELDRFTEDKPLKPIAALFHNLYFCSNRKSHSNMTDILLDETFLISTVYTWKAQGKIAIKKS